MKIIIPNGCREMRQTTGPGVSPPGGTAERLRDFAFSYKAHPPMGALPY